MHKIKDYFNYLPEDLIRYIFTFDNTYHYVFNDVKTELLSMTRLLYIVLEARYSNHKRSNGTIIYEYKDTEHYNLGNRNGNISELYWKYHILDKI